MSLRLTGGGDIRQVQFHERKVAGLERLVKYFHLILDIYFPVCHNWGVKSESPNPRYEQLAVKILNHLKVFWDVGDCVTSPAKQISVTEIITTHLAPTDAALLAAEEAIRLTAIRAYNIGKLVGHEDTVEGRFTIIMPQDLATYDVESVDEMLADTSLPEGKEALEKIRALK